MRIYQGQMLLRTDAKLPEQLSLQGTRLNSTWLLLEEDAHTLDKYVRAAEWHFFWLSHEVQAWALALDEQAALEAALRKAVGKIDRRYNAAEIIAIKRRKLLGIYFCRVHVSVRHIQPGPILGLTETVGIISPGAHSRRPLCSQP